MSRPMKGRNVCNLPRNDRFGPLGRRNEQNGEIIMTVDEYETIRLIDEVGLTQEECARQMNVARTTVQSIYTKARRKLANSLVNGIALTISGGEYRLCDGWGDGCRRGYCHRHGREIGASERSLAEQQEEKHEDSSSS